MTEKSNEDVEDEDIDLTIGGFVIGILYFLVIIVLTFLPYLIIYDILHSIYGPDYTPQEATEKLMNITNFDTCDWIKNERHIVCCNLTNSIKHDCTIYIPDLYGNLTYRIVD